MDITSLLSSDAHWNVNKHLAKQIGIVPTILLMELIFCRKKYGENEFYESVEKLDERLGIGREARRSAMKTLVDSGLIIVTKKGVPARYFYSIDDSKIMEILTTREAETSTPSETGTRTTGEVETHPTINKKEIKNENKNIDNKEQKISPPLRRDNDPFAIVHDTQTAIIIYDEIKNHFVKEYKVKPQADSIACANIASKMIYEDEEEIRQDVRNKILAFLYDPYWANARPTPKLLSKAWDQLSEKNIPKHVKNNLDNNLVGSTTEDIVEDLVEIEVIPPEQAKANLDEMKRIFGELP